MAWHQVYAMIYFYLNFILYNCVAEHKLLRGCVEDITILKSVC